MSYRRVEVTEMNKFDMVILGDERAADLGGVDDEAVTMRIPDRKSVV